MLERLFYHEMPKDVHRPGRQRAVEPKTYVITSMHLCALAHTEAKK